MSFWHKFNILSSYFTIFMSNCLKKIFKLKFDGWVTANSWPNYSGHSTIPARFRGGELWKIDVRIFSKCSLCKIYIYNRCCLHFRPAPYWHIYKWWAFQHLSVWKLCPLRYGRNGHPYTDMIHLQHIKWAKNRMTLCPHKAWISKQSWNISHIFYNVIFVTDIL